MTLAKVAGTVVSSVRGDTLSDPRCLVIELCREDGECLGEYLIALDLVGAGEGEMVMVSQGSSCRWTRETEGQPVDALIVGIIDRIDCGEETVYRSG